MPKESNIIHVDGPDYYGFTWRNIAGKYVAVCSLTNNARGGFNSLAEAVQYLVNSFEEATRV
jgi:hypothetical protein